MRTLRALLAEVGPVAEILRDAPTEDKARLYNDLGIELTYNAERRLVQVEAAPIPVYSGSCRRGDLNPEHTPALLRGELKLT
jgi:hypothetical protein